MSVKIEKIVDPVTLGEGPHWDEKQNALYFVSILDKTIHKYVPATGKHTKTKLDGRVGFIVPVEGTKDQFVVGVERDFLVVKWDGQEGSPATTVRRLATVDDGKTTRINDGKADARGRLFAGTMGHEEPLGNVDPHQGSLFRLDGSAIKSVADRIHISNGLAWDLKEKAMYYTDSLEKNIRRYDYDVETGEISNMRHIFDFEKNKIPGVPDGSTLDSDGNLWVAVFSGGRVLKVDPRTGQLLYTLTIPAAQVTSVTWGGRGLSTLFVTSANLPVAEAPLPAAGALFQVTGLGAKGLINNTFKL